MHESKRYYFIVVIGLRLRRCKRKEKKRLKPKEVEHSKKIILLKQNIPSKHTIFPSLSTNA
jgi:hypothetical protein